MNRRTRIRQLLRLRSSDDERVARHARSELQKLGYSVSRRGSPSAGRATRQAPAQPVVTTLRLGADTHRRLQLLAADEGKSANAIIEKLLRRHLDAQGVPSRLKRRR